MVLDSTTQHKGTYMNKQESSATKLHFIKRPPQTLPVHIFFPIFLSPLVFSSAFFFFNLISSCSYLLPSSQLAWNACIINDSFIAWGEALSFGKEIICLRYHDINTLYSSHLSKTICYLTMLFSKVSHEGSF